MFNQALKQFILFSFFSILLWVISWQIEKFSSRTPDVKGFAQKLEKKLHAVEEEVNGLFQSKNFINRAIDNDFDLDSVKKYEEKPYSILIYNKADTLIYWNNNKVQPYKSDCQFENQFIRKPYEIAGSKYLMIKNPIEKIIDEELHQYTFIALIPIYLRFPINNNYLVNYFALMPDDFSCYIDLGNEKDNVFVKDSKGNSLLTLKAKEDIPYRNFIYWAYLGYFISILLFLGISYKMSVKILEKFGFFFGFASFIFIVLLLRFFTIQSDFPESVTSLTIFKTAFSIDSQYWCYSLGDFLFDISVFAILSAFFVQKSNFHRLRKWNLFLKITLGFFVYTFIITGILLLQVILNGIVQNSDVYFEFEVLVSLFWVRWYSFQSQDTPTSLSSRSSPRYNPVLTFSFDEGACWGVV